MLSAKEITRQYFRQGKGTNVFNAVEKTDFDIPQECLTVVMGRSGSGKSTLLNMMAGLLEPTTGKILLDETDLYSLPDAERARLRGIRLGIIPQGQTALRALTVLENVLLPVRVNAAQESKSRDKERGKTPELSGTDEMTKRALTLLEEVGIAALKDVYPDELSGGERRRLAIARAMILQPDYLLADEPTADLDDENTAEVLGILRRYADAGKGVLLVTHEPEAVNVADRQFRMSGGRLTEE